MGPKLPKSFWNVEKPYSGRGNNYFNLKLFIQSILHRFAEIASEAHGWPQCLQGSIMDHFGWYFVSRVTERGQSLHSLGFKCSCQEPFSASASALSERGCLTHLSLDKMAAISQTIRSNAFSWMKTFVFWFEFHWSLFPRVRFTISQIWFR